MSAEDAVRIIRNINLWWVVNFTEKADKLHDKFPVSIGRTFVYFEITELITTKKVAWKVNECFLPWLKDEKERNDTEVILELSE